VRATTHALPDAEAIRAFSVGERHGDFYPRYGHSNGTLWESLVAEAEHAQGAVAFASGMAAMHAAISALVRAGDRVLIQEQVYGGTEALALHELPRCGVDVLRFDALDREALARGLAAAPKVVVLETPINPTLRLIDLREAATLCRAAGAVSVVDGTFAPPPIQRPLDLGIDLVVHSATKFYGGHSDVMAGVVAGGASHLQEIVKLRSRTGAILAPDPAWLLCRSFPTLELRVLEQQRNAAAVASSLDALRARDERIVAVSYPGLPSHADHALAQRQMRGGGALVTITVAGGLEGARRTFDRLRHVAKGPSLGGTEALASLPRFTTHARVPPEVLARNGIHDGMLRLSIGLGDPALVTKDIQQALE
jgi:methionine-gamma-lyase